MYTKITLMKKHFLNLVCIFAICNYCNAQSEVFIDDALEVCNIFVYEDFLYYEYVEKVDGDIVKGKLYRTDLREKIVNPEFLFETSTRIAGIAIKDDIIYYSNRDSRSILSRSLYDLSAPPDSIGTGLHNATELEIVGSSLYVTATKNPDFPQDMLVFDLENIEESPELLFRHLAPWTIVSKDNSLYITGLLNLNIYKVDLDEENLKLEAILPDSIMFPVGIAVVENTIYFTNSTGSEQNVYDANISKMDLNDPAKKIETVYEGLESHHALVHYDNSLFVAEFHKNRITKVEIPVITSQSNVEQTKFNLYPNPAIDYVVVDSEVGKIYEIYSVDGSLIKSGNLTISRTISLEALPVGAYFINVVGVGSSIIHKIK